MNDRLAFCDVKNIKGQPFLIRLLHKFRIGDGCWEWTAAQNDVGYGQIGRNNKVIYAHRAVYELLNGPIPTRLTLDHLCRNRKCVRPDHLEPVTLAENIRRGTGGAANRAKQTCPRGHPYDRVHARGDGTRFRACSICTNASVKAGALRRKRFAQAFS